MNLSKAPTVMNKNIALLSMNHQDLRALHKLPNVEVNNFASPVPTKLKQIRHEATMRKPNYWAVKTRDFLARKPVPSVVAPVSVVSQRTADMMMRGSASIK